MCWVRLVSSSRLQVPVERSRCTVVEHVTASTRVRKSERDFRSNRSDMKLVVTALLVAVLSIVIAAVVAGCDPKYCYDVCLGLCVRDGCVCDLVTSPAPDTNDSLAVPAA